MQLALLSNNVLRAAGVLTVVAAGAIAAPKLFGSVRAQEPSPPAEARPLPVDSQVVRIEPGYDAPRRFTGELRARRTSSLGFRRTDRLTELLVQEGDVIQAGDLVARLDVEALDARRKAIAASLDAARARLEELERGAREEAIEAARERVVELVNRAELARLVERRRAELAADSHTSQEDADRARLEARATEAQLAQAREVLRELENGTRDEVLRAERARVAEIEARVVEVDVDLEQSVLTAPFDGVVTDVLAELGGVVAPLQSVVRMVESTGLEAWIGMPGEALSAWEEQRSCSVTIAGRGYGARLRATLPELDPTTRLQIAIFEIDGARLGEVSLGELVSIEHTERVEERGFWIEAPSLVRSRRGLWAVYALAPEGDLFRLERREVELLHQEGERVYVRGPVADGERVLASGAQRVATGQVVEIEDTP